MSLSKKTGAAALATTFALAMPGVALAGGGHGHGDGPRGGGIGADVPSRIASKLRAAERALERAEERADDGNVAGAVSQLGAVRKKLASGTKSALKRIVASSETGIGSAGAVASTDHRVVAGTLALLDGAPDELVTASASTLDAALDSRDSVVSAIAALADRSGYERVLEDVADDAADEVESIDESLSDDTLTDAAKAALGEARTQAQATAAAASAAAGSSSDDVADYPGSGPSQTIADGPRRQRGDCPEGGRGRGAGAPAPSTGQGETTGTYPGQV